jgi:hypothetical protein
MNQRYQKAIVESQFLEAVRSVAESKWEDTELHMTGLVVLCHFAFADGKYLARIDASEYPVEPYWVGFLDPATSRDQWLRACDGDARYWPWSPMPGLHGSFNLTFGGSYRVFWCRECTRQFFHYHGDHPWQPASWPMARVVSHLRDAALRATPPGKWLPIEMEGIRVIAANMNVQIPRGDDHDGR